MLSINEFLWFPRISPYPRDERLISRITVKHLNKDLSLLEIHWKPTDFTDNNNPSEIPMNYPSKKLIKYWYGNLQTVSHFVGKTVDKCWRQTIIDGYVVGNILHFNFIFLKFNTLPTTIPLVNKVNYQQ